MVLAGVHLTLFYMHHTRIIYHYPHLLGLALPLPLLHGALIYLYCLSVTRANFVSTGVVTLCLLPFITLCALTIPFFILSADQKVYVFQQEGAGFEWFIIVQSILIPFCGLLFSVLTIVEIRKHRERLLNTFSNHDKKMLTWLMVVALCLAIIWILSVPFEDAIIFDAVVWFILIIGLLGIRQAPVFYTHHHAIAAPAAWATDTVQHHYQPLLSHSPAATRTSHERTPVATVDQIADENKYAKSGLKAENLSRLKRSLDDYMKHAKPYKDPDLSLDGLAAMLHLPSNQLSQIINATEGKTFYHYINTYRISEFLEVASQPESRKFTYQGLASDCGFGSKSTFNKYFKLRTGKTPSEYFG